MKIWRINENGDTLDVSANERSSADLNFKLANKKVCQRLHRTAKF